MKAQNKVRMLVRTPAVILALLFFAMTVSAQNKPNIIVIMGDDIGWFNIGVYNQGMMAGLTPNLDKLAAQGMRFNSYYAEASCTAGRANFITGELPIRTGMTTVGQAGAKIGIPDQAITIATALKAMGYETGRSARTILETVTSISPPSMASTSSGDTSITSMPWRIRSIPAIRSN